MGAQFTFRFEFVRAEQADFAPRRQLADETPQHLLPHAFRVGRNRDEAVLVKREQAQKPIRLISELPLRKAT
jgi:hypothetical protein